MDELIAVVKLFAGNFAPQGYPFCDGSTLQINQNQALFALIGIQFGGNGTTTFTLPNLKTPTENSGKTALHYIICIQGVIPASY